ncbi:MAG: hypothetical protein MUF24_02815 [Chitinophagaceae bacterium]|jgi:hypothetical protein|nr:hypothetical protein [Chitinophagaceae bacterium]
MKSILELNETKVPAVRIDKTLDKYDNVVLFPDKLDKANKMVEHTNLKEIMKKKMVKANS